MKIKAAIIVDNLSLKKWQLEAIHFASDILEIAIILNCTNSHSQVNIFKNFFYYALRFFSLRSSYTENIKISFSDSRTISFTSGENGRWQSIPNTVIEELNSNGIRLIIKFGMGLLRVDGAMNIFTILSFHHGDPAFFRGRPAGFYEILQNAESVGIVVQRLTDDLDAGVIFSSAQSKIFHYSYKDTSINFYKNSKFLLRKALKNYSVDCYQKLEKFGPNYHLPSNLLVCFFIFKLCFRKIKRLLYGLFIEKRWNIALFSFDGHNIPISLDIHNGLTPSINSPYTFYADPFFSQDGKSIFCEGMHSLSGLGEIIQLDRSNLNYSQSILNGRHYSYPSVLMFNGLEGILPETASHSGSHIYFAPFGSKSSMVKVLGIEDLRLIDATLFEHHGTFFLFGGQGRYSEDTLELFYSDNAIGPFHRHPCSPIVINPKGARMGGAIFKVDNKIYRFGQNNCYGYGNGLIAFEIINLTKNLYNETYVDEISLINACGPHTINFHDGQMIIDFYNHTFSFLSGYRRLTSIVWNKFPHVFLKNL